MKYMIMLYTTQQDYGAFVGRASAGQPAWSADDVAKLHAFMEQWHKSMAESGELVDAHGLAAPVHTRRVELKDGAPVVTDGPYAETQEVLAGYDIVECESFDRATEIAARLTRAPHPESVSREWYVDIRPVDDGPDEPEI